MGEELTEKKVAFLTFSAAIVLNIFLMPQNLVYDECWSLLFFSPLGIVQILSDLSLPNNHPLNTLLLKILSELSVSALMLRLPSLICGALVPVLCGKLAYCWSEEPNRIKAMIYAGILAVFSAPLAVYGGVARGYAMQMFFLLLCIWAMVKLKDSPRRYSLLTAAGGIGTILSVPDGALFLLPAGVGFLLYAPKELRKNINIWSAAGVIAIFAGIFYGINFSALRSGQSWGMKIDSTGDFLIFLSDTAKQLLLIPALLVAIPVWVKWRSMIFLLFLPLLLALVSNGGPARCYLYLPAAIAVAGGMKFAELSAKSVRVKWIISVTVLFVAVISFGIQIRQWSFVDYASKFEQFHREYPSGMLPVYNATAGFPVRCMADQKMHEHFILQLALKNFDKLAVFENENGEFNGMDAERGEKTFRSDLRGEFSEAGNLPCRIYGLERCAGKNFIAGENYLLTGTNDLTHDFGEYGEILELNPWLTKNEKMYYFHCRRSLVSSEAIDIYRITGRACE